MQKLHLVGVTTDRDGLILSVRRGARSGSYLLPVDDDLMAAVDEHRQHQAEQEDAPEEEATAAPRLESTLPVREIQARLRRGRSVAEVAKAAGVDEAWVERFAPPVLAERARVIAAARGLSLDRPRLGPSVVPLGEAVARHLVDRGVSMTPEEQAERWTAHLLDGGRWTVRFAFRYRGKERVLAYELDEPAGSLAALDRTSGQMGYVAPSAPPVGGRSGAATQGRERGEPSRPSRERERATAAMRKVATRQAADAERAVARRAEERAKLAASQPTPDVLEPVATPAPTGTAKKAKASPKKPAKPAKKPAKPARKAKAPARKAKAPAKKATGPAKKPAKPARKAKAPARKAKAAARKAAAPAKKGTGPAKAAGPAKKATAPATKGAKPANKATKAAKKTPPAATAPSASQGATSSKQTAARTPARATNAAGPTRKAATRAAAPEKQTATSARGAGEEAAKVPPTATAITPTPPTASGPTSTGAKTVGSAGDTAGAASEATRIEPDRVAPTGQAGSAPSSAAGDPERAVDEPDAIPRRDHGAPGARRVIPPRTPLERARAREGEPSGPPPSTEGAAEPAPRFRFNLVEPAGTAPRPAGPEDGDDGASPSAVDGARPARRPPGRPPRTRPLRAT